MGHDRETGRIRVSAWQPRRVVPAKSIIVGLLAVVALLLLGTVGVAQPSGASQLSKAKKSLLVLADLPKGWTSSKASNSNAPFPGAAQLASCIGVPTSVITYNAPSVSSPDFSSKNQLLSVGDSVQVYRSSKAAQVDFSSYANAKTPSCMTADLNGPGRAEFDAQMGGGVGTVTVTRTPASDYAPHSTNFTMFLPVTTEGVTVNVELTVVDYVKGRQEQTVVLSAFQSTFPTSLARHLTMVADGRI
jgi:hypothetical protein